MRRTRNSQRGHSFSKAGSEARSHARTRALRRPMPREEALRASREARLRIGSTVALVEDGGVRNPELQHRSLQLLSPSTPPDARVRPVREKGEEDDEEDGQYQSHNHHEAASSWVLIRLVGGEAPKILLNIQVPILLGPVQCRAAEDVLPLDPGAGLGQVLHYLQVAILYSSKERRGAVVSDLLLVGSGVAKTLHHLQVALHGSQVQRGCPVLPLPIQL
mmetsp:Transcript_33049/g.102563  ORF Transcript_33049/g.102563 Transcript_33049/m.102563 type:complete len:219 (+) Transcript_33049:95-751(+)